MSTAQIKALEDYFRLMDRNSMAHAIRAAVDLGVIDCLKKGQKTNSELATELSLSPESLQLLMRVLCRSELVEQYEDDYALSQVGRLIPDRFLHMGDHHWQYLGGFIKSGKPLPVDEELPVTDADFLLQQASQEWTQTPAAMDAATILDIGDSRKDLRILEVGCGAAVFSVAISHRDPGSQLTLLDRGPELKRAMETVEGVGLEERVSYLETDYLQDGWVEGLEESEFDMVIVAGIAHRHNQDECQQLFANIAKLCHPGTNLVIIDVFPGQEKGDAHRELFELQLGLRTSKGALHDAKQLQSQLKSLGFDDVQYAPLPAAPHIWGLVLAAYQG